ncbi:MAG TPA: CsgG/HfaB family protein [Bryobacteraceae bacterium]|jgi:curli biogenesis system outer membrane secretion channel CsgG|nr:CsgG/HfaB family protein [Bryobacteraceae bacterium]
MKRFLFSMLVFASIATAQNKTRVAVMNFEYGTVYSGVAGVFGSNVDVGKGIADMLVDRLVKDGSYSVIERKELDKVLGEQNFSNSNRADPSSAAKIGKVLGVSAIIIGSITQFGRDDHNTSVGAGAVGGLTRGFGIGGVGRKEAKAVVEISARMISTDTAEILAVASGKGESQRSGTTLLGAGGSSGGAGGAGIDMSSSNFGATIIGEATNKAVTQMAQGLSESAAKIPTVVIAVDGLVADVNGGSLILNVGSRGGVRVGDKLQVTRVGREIKDPATGKVIRRTESPMGTITITEVDDASAVGNYDGTAGVKVGDRVKR